MSSSGKHASKGAFTKHSVSAVAIVVLALVQEFGSLILGNRGGAFSHVVWWAMGEPFTWRWALAGAPVLGLLVWCLPHFAFQWGTGVHLLAIIAATFAVMAFAVLIH